MDEDIQKAAQRELKEETGITAKTWENIMCIHTSNSVTDEVGYIFLATGLDHGQPELEESEADLAVKKVSLKQAVEMVMDQEITDSMSVAGLLKVARMKGLR